MATINVAELHKLGCTGISITSASRTADTAQMTFALRSDGKNGAPFGFGEELIIVEDDNVLFRGWVTEEPEISVDASHVNCTVQAGNIVALLDATPFIESQSFSAILQSAGESRLVDAGVAIRFILGGNMVAPGGADANVALEVDFASTIRCPVGSGSQSCWSLVESVLHWVPDASSWYDPSRNSLAIRNTGSKYSMVLDLQQGKALVGDAPLFSFAGFESANFRPRYDLCPPAVGVFWERNKQSVVFPAGETLIQPWAFALQVPSMGGSGGVLKPENIRPLQNATQPTMLVQGLQVPVGWVSAGNMKEKAPGAPADWHKFWSGFAGMLPLAKTNVSCLSFGTAVFEPVPIDEAYPLDSEDAEQPENYEPFVAGGSNEKIYVLTQGQFPASSKKRDNVGGGLKFCKGKLKQYVWLDSNYVGELSLREKREFFSGIHPLKQGDNMVKTRYALLELDAIFINRRRKKFQVGTNKLDDSDDDFVPDDDNTGGGGEQQPSTIDYTLAARSYYNATRQLFYDGSITLRGVEGYSPSKINGVLLNVFGARDEWAGMNTPIVQAQYDPQKRTLVLSTGSPEILTIDERLHRMQLGRQNNAFAGTSFADPPAVNDSTGDGEQDEQEQYPMVSPSISAQASVAKSGKPLNPFQLYSDENGSEIRWYLNEGTLPAPGGKVVDFPTTDVTDIVNEDPDVKLSVRVEREKGTQNWVAVIRKRK